MTHRRRILKGLVFLLATAAVGGGLFFSGVFTTQAVQANKMPSGMDPNDHDGGNPKGGDPK